MRETIDRRTILQMSAGAAAITSLPNTVSAEGHRKMSGVTYDTLTHHTGKNATAQVEKENGDIQSGFITTPGFRLPLDDLNIVSKNPARTRYKKEFTDDRYIKNKDSLILNIYDWGDQISGYLTRNSDEFGKRGLLLVGGDGPSNAHLRSAFTPNNKWEKMDKKFKLPKKGVPTDTGISRRIKIERRK